MSICVCVVLQVSARHVASVRSFFEAVRHFLCCQLVYYLLIEMLQKVTHTRMELVCEEERAVASSLIGPLAASFATPSSNV